MTLTTERTILIRIEDFDHDDLAGGGKAPLTLGMSKCLNAGRQMNGSASSSGGWGQSAMRAWMPTLLTAALRSPGAHYRPRKDLRRLGGSSHIEVTSDKLWLFSEVEVGSTFVRPRGGDALPALPLRRRPHQDGGGLPIGVVGCARRISAPGVHFCSVDAQGRGTAPPRQRHGRSVGWIFVFKGGAGMDVSSPGIGGWPSSRSSASWRGGSSRRPG